MARRACVTPFSPAPGTIEGSHRRSTVGTHSPSQSQTSIPYEIIQPQSPHSMYARPQPVPALLESPYAPPSGSTNGTYYNPDPGLPPIQSQPQPRSTGLLPGVAELITGVSPYSTPAGTPNPVFMVAASGDLTSGSAYANVEVVSETRRVNPDISQHQIREQRCEDYLATPDLVGHGSFQPPRPQRWHQVLCIGG
jgi:hypothetical protein